MKDNTNSLAHTMYNCKYHIVFVPKYRNRVFWCRGYYVGTVGKNTNKIKEYIRNQMKEDEEMVQMTIDFKEDPFKGGK